MSNANKVPHDQLVKQVAQEAQVPQAVTRKVLRGLSTVVSTELVAGKQVGIPGLGSWHTTFYKSHFGTAQGQRTVIKGHKRLRWHTATATRKKLNPQLYDTKKQPRKK